MLDFSMRYKSFQVLGFCYKFLNKTELSLFLRHLLKISSLYVELGKTMCEPLF